jgi:hypothetical protein
VLRLQKKNIRAIKKILGDSYASKLNGRGEGILNSATEYYGTYLILKRQN